ncbi:MAG: enoyl-CoA hydratase [Burkholderiaceae bacterium]
MDILIRKEDGVCTIELNRPDKKNAITAAMYQSLGDALHDAERDEKVGAVFLIGHAEAFTAGYDLQDLAEQPPVYPHSPVFHFMRQLSHASKPVVAAVCGPAIGIGTTMLLHCDLVYAADDARFGMPFTQLGLCPEFASTLLLPQTTGYRRAAEKLLLGESFDSREACEIGLVNKVLPVAQLMSHAHAQAVKLASLPASSVRLTKRLMKSTGMEMIDARIAEESRHFSAMLNASAAQDAFARFLKKAG